MHQEEVVHVHNGILAMEKHGTMLLAPPYKDLEIITLPEVRKKTKDRYPITSLIGVT